MLKNLIKGGDFPHLMIYGPSGSGKKTRISCLLREIFGSSVEKLKIQHQVIETPAKKKIEVKTISSNYHIEINPSDAGFDDRVVISELIKSHASTQLLHSEDGVSPLKVVVVSEADKLTKEAQQALRRTMEKYSGTCRLILSAELSCRIIPAIKSRTLMVRVAAPNYDSIAKIVMNVAKEEGFHLPQDTAKQIATTSRRNLRRALMMTETMFVQKSDSPSLPRWQIFVKELASKMMEKQTNYGVEEIRAGLYQLQAHLIPSEMIFELLVRELLSNPKLSQEAKIATINLAAFYENRCRMGNKPIIHLESFVAQFMVVSKTY